jgi:soluble lytic murein transglycosylase
LLDKHQQNAWVLAALARAFAEAGTYSLSITSAERMAALAPGGNILAAPVALQRLAYPLAFEDLVRTESARRGLDPRLVAAVIRQESRFETGARSYAAAQGLMQVIPATADWIAQQMGWRNFQSEQIYWPYVNVAFGTFYLQHTLQQFDNSIPLALAGYNGGPGNAAIWREAAPDDPDLMVALINVSESRLYVQLVWTHYQMYQRLYPR